MKAIYLAVFVVIMAIIGRVDASERIQPVPAGTKIYIQGAGKENRFMLYRFATDGCERAYGYVDNVTGKTEELPRTEYSCSSPRGPRLIDGPAGISVVMEYGADSFYFKKMEI